MTGVVEAVLGSLSGMDVNKNFDVVFGAHVENPLDFIGGTIHAANIRAIWVESPVTDWYSNNLDTTSREV